MAKEIFPCPKVISTHAPARGATRSNYEIFGDFFYFNPRSREGSDYNEVGNFEWLQKFQPTLPRGERPYRHQILISPYHFNPRSREGSDLLRKLSLRLDINFNPRSREGSDFNSSYSPSTLHTFQPTLPRGERR